MEVKVTVILAVDEDEGVDFVDVEDSVREALEDAHLPPGVEVVDTQAEEV